MALEGLLYFCGISILVSFNYLFALPIRLDLNRLGFLKRLLQRLYFVGSRRQTVMQLDSLIFISKFLRRLFTQADLLLTLSLF